MANYELPNNSMIESMLDNNLKTINPLKMKEKKTFDNKKLFPFWTPVDNEGSETFEDYTKYLNERDKKVRAMKTVLGDNTGIVKPKDEMGKSTVKKLEGKSFDYSDNSIASTVFKSTGKKGKSEFEDMTGVVEPKTEGMPKGSTKQVIDTDTSFKVEVDSNAAKPKGDDLTGIVKPKALLKTVTIDSMNKITKTTTELGVSQVGIVKPKSEDMPTGTKKKVIDNDVSSKVETKDKINVKAGGIVLGDKTGVVKPQASLFVTNIPSVKNAMKTTSVASTETESKVKTPKDGFKSVDNVGVVKPVKNDVKPTPKKK